MQAVEWKRTDAENSGNTSRNVVLLGDTKVVFAVAAGMDVRPLSDARRRVLYRSMP